MSELQQAAQDFWRSPSVTALGNFRDALHGAKADSGKAAYATMQQLLRSDWDPSIYTYELPRMPGAGNPPDEPELALLDAKLPVVKPSYFKNAPGWMLVGPRVGRAGLYEDASGGRRNHLMLPRGQFALLEAQALHAGAREKLGAWDDTQFRVDFPQPLPVVAISALGELVADSITAVQGPEHAPGCDEGEGLSLSAPIGDAAAHAGVDLVLVQPAGGLVAKATVRNVTLNGASGRVFDLDGDGEADAYLIQYSADLDAGWDPRMEVYLNVAGQWVYGGARVWARCRN